MSNAVIAIAVTVIFFTVVVRILVISIPDFAPHPATAGMAWRIFRCTIIPDNNVVGMAILFRRDDDSPLLLLVPSFLLRRPAAATAFALPREFRLQCAVLDGISLGFPTALGRPDAHRDRIVVSLVIQQSLPVTLLQYPQPSIVQ